MFDHAVSIDTEAGLTLGCRLQVCKDVHAGGVPPDKERLAVLDRLFHEAQCRLGDFLVHCLHALLRQRAGVFNLAAGETMDDAAGAKLFLEGRILWVVHILRLFLRVEMIEVAVEFVEAVIRREHLIAVAEVVLTKLAGDVPERLEQLGNGNIFLLQTFRCARQADLGESSADGRLAGDERGAARGAALLAVPIGEQHTFLRDTVDVRGLVTHHALVVGADVEDANVIAPDDEDVGLVCRKCQAGYKNQTNNDREHNCHFHFHILLLVDMLFFIRIPGMIPLIQPIRLI